MKKPKNINVPDRPAQPFTRPLKTACLDPDTPFFLPKEEVPGSDKAIGSTFTPCHLGIISVEALKKPSLV